MEEGAERLGDVTRTRAQLGPAFSLKADIELAQIMQTSEHTQSSPTDLAELLTCEVAQPASPDGKIEQRFNHCGHICRVIHEWVPLAR